ncbi:CLUMA_CG016607, isoform A [Clunio marinus]|uniref:CLUMA_CG016607, isoform A n=1 Tax=Clunio marinus TaxID=568069 RepID=A0A1J1IU64_9DIPT|nr:CLUMA_CG016607, isoform A [Clunio marinus]
MFLLVTHKRKEFEQQHQELLLACKFINCLQDEGKKKEKKYNVQKIWKLRRREKKTTSNPLESRKSEN